MDARVALADILEDYADNVAGRLRLSHTTPTGGRSPTTTSRRTSRCSSEPMQFGYSASSVSHTILVRATRSRQTGYGRSGNG